MAEIDQACKDTCAKMGLEDCYVRPVAYRGPEAVSVSAIHNKTHVAIAVWDWPSYFDSETKARGIRLEWAKWRRPDPATAPSAAKAAMTRLADSSSTVQSVYCWGEGSAGELGNGATLDRNMPVLAAPL